MAYSEQVFAWLTSHAAIIVTVGTAIYEIVGRIWPTAKRASIFSWIGKALVLIAKLSWALSDILSKIIPDNRASETVEPKKEKTA